MPRPPSRFIEYQGVWLTVSQFAGEVGLATGIVRTRMQRFDPTTESGLARIADPRILSRSEAGRRGKAASYWTRPLSKRGT